MKPKLRRAATLASFFSVVVCTSSAHAANLYWDVNGTGTGFSTVVGAWNGSNAFWNDQITGTGGTPTATVGNTDDLNIVAATTNTGTITLSGTQAASSISFASAVGSVTLSGGTSLTIGGTGALSGIFKSSTSAQAITTPMILNTASEFSNTAAGNFSYGPVNLNGNALTFNGSGLHTFVGSASNVISGAGGIVKNGSGTLILDAAAPNAVHTFTGGITVNGGTISQQTGTNLTGRGNVTLNGGILGMRFSSNLTYAGGLGTGTTAIQILGGASGFSGEGATSSAVQIGTALSVLKWGATGENGATGFFNPTVLVLGGDANMNIDAKGSMNNGIDLNGTNRTITSLHSNGNGAANTGFTVSGVISNTTGTAGFEKTGPGNIILGNTANTFNGALTITGGSITVGNTGSLGSASNTLVFNGGSLLSSAGFTSPATRAVTMTQTGIINTNTFAVSILGNIDGSGGLTKNSTGALTLSGTNTFGGVTTVNAGSLVITKESSLASNTAANLNVKSGATLQLNVDSAGTAGFTSANLSTLLGNISVANTSAQGLLSGATLAFDTTTATGTTFTQGNAITDSTGASGGKINFVKLGTGTLVFDKANTYTGTTTISAGTLRFDTGGSVTGQIINNATIIFNQNASTGTAPLVSTTFGGTGSIAAATGSTVTINTTNGLLFTGIDTSGGGSFVLNGVTKPTFGGLSGTSGNLSSAFSSGYNGATNLILNTPSGSTFTYAGVIDDGASGMHLTKMGAGTQILTGNNTYTGTTFLNGGTLQLGVGSTPGKITGTTAIEFNGGTLQFNRSGTTDLLAIPNGAPITVNSSSTFGVTSADAGNANANETVGAVTLSAGQMSFNWTNGGSSGTQMILTSLSRSGTASANFNSGFSTGNSRWKVTGAGTTTAGQIVGPWYTTGGNAAGFASTDYATYSSDFVAQAAIAGSAETTWTTAANAYTANAGAAAGGSAGLAATRTITALRSISGANAMTVDNVGNTFSLTSNTFANGDAFVLGGTAPTGLTSGTTYYVVGKSGNTFQVAATPGGAAIDFSTNGTSVTATGAITLSTGNNLETYGLLNGVATTALVQANGTGALTTPTGGGNFYVNAGAGAITVNAPINNNGGNVALVKNGANTLTLGSTTSDYSGGTVINAGTIAFGAATNLGAANSAITFNGTATLQDTTGTTLVDLGTSPVAVADGAVAIFSMGSRGNLTFGGAVTGAGGITVTNANFWSQLRFNNTANTFTGPITVSPTSSSDGNWVFSFNSIDDVDVTPGSGNITLSSGSNSQAVGIDYGSGATSSLTLNNRQIVLGSQTAAGVYINNAGSQAMTINSDLGFSGSGARVLTLGRTTTLASGSGISTFAGKLTDNSFGGALTVTAAGGTWLLTNSNTHTGNTTVSTGTLALTNSNAVQNSALTVSGGTLSLRHNTNNTTYADASTTISASATINVDNNGSGTGNTLKLGAVNVSAATTATLTVTNGNSYALGLGVVTQSPTTATTLTVANAAPLSMASFTTNSAATPKLSFTGTGNATITGNLTQSGSGALALERATAAGTLILQGTSTMTGAVTITNGTIQTGVATNAFGSTSGISIGGSGTLALRGDASTAFSNGTTNYPVTLTASGATINVDQAVSAAGGTTLTLGTVAMGGAYTLNTTGANGVGLGLGAISGSTANNKVINNTIASPGGLTIASYAETNASARTITFQGSGNTTVAGDITQNGANALALTKNGAGTLTVGGTNNYTGNTSVSAGTLAVTGSLGATAVSVSNLATLSGNGNIGGNVSIASGATHSLAVAATAGAQVTRAITGTLTLTSGNILDLTAAVTPAAGEYVLATATTAISGTPTTINYNGITGLVSVDTASNPKRLLLNVTGGDAVPPTLTSIADNVTGGPVDINATVTYAVTFNEDMDASTVSAADFGNAGTATASIGTVTETSPGVFTVQATPSTSGSLQLRINAAAVLKDVAGNDLDTTSALIDDTTITVRTPYATWAAGYLPGADVSNPALNFDGDGLTNLQEYAFGTDPTATSGGSITWVEGGAVTNPGLPVAFDFSSGGGVDYRAVFGRRKDYLAAGLTYTVQFSADLILWQNGVATPSLRTGAGGLNPSEIEAVSVPYPTLFVPLQAGGFGKPTFLRVVVSY